MSLINQMLKDLDRRHASTAELPPLSGGQPAGASRKAIRWVLGAALLLAGGVLGWMQWAARPQPVPVVQRVAAKPPAPSPRSAAPPSQAAVPSAPEAPASSRLPGLDKELRSAPPDTAAPLPPPQKHSATAVGAIPAVPSSGAEAGSDAALPLAEAKLPAARAAQPPRAAHDMAMKNITPQQKSDNLYRQGMSQLQQGRVAEARSTLWQALDENAANHDARQLLVGLLLENRRNGDAALLLQDGIKLAPEQSGFALALAHLQVDAGNRQAALQTLEQGLGAAADDADYHGFYAALLQREERHGEAVAQYVAALRNDPANTGWLIGIGISLQAQDQFADARAAFERARQIGQLTPELARFVDQRLAQLTQKLR